MVLNHSRRDPWTVQEQMRLCFGEDVSFRSLTTSQSSSSCRTRQRKCGAPISTDKDLEPNRSALAATAAKIASLCTHFCGVKEVWTWKLATFHGIGFPPALSKRRLLLVLRFSILPACSQTSINIPIHHPIIIVLRNWGTVIGRSFP